MTTRKKPVAAPKENKVTKPAEKKAPATSKIERVVVRTAAEAKVLATAIAEFASKNLHTKNMKCVLTGARKAERYL